MKFNYIILLTDFGERDNFTGVMKGVIHKTNPDIKIIDLCHRITPQNIFQAGFLLKHSFSYFPDRSIFLNIVDPGVGSERDIIILKNKKQLFIAPDNGLLSFIQAKGVKYYKLIIPNKYLPRIISSTFHGRDIFAPITATISKGVDLNKICIPVPEIKKIPEKEAKIEKNKISGEVIYIDTFGNLTTNIEKEYLFNFVNLKNSFKIKIKNITLRRISNTYSIKEKYGAIFNSFNLLEIFSPEGNVSGLLKAVENEKVIVI